MKTCDSPHTHTSIKKTTLCSLALCVQKPESAIECPCESDQAAI
jgi:hypothetical protein